MKSIESITKQIEILTNKRNNLNKIISTLEGRLKIEKIRKCTGTLIYIGEDRRDNYIYECNKCKNIHILSLAPKSHKCKNNI